MRRFIFLLLLTCLYNKISAQSTSYRLVDERIINMTTPKDIQLKALVQWITGGATDEFQKVRAIFDWVSTNIRYDFATFKSGYYKSSAYHFKSPEDVLNKRLGICSEISKLVQEMLFQSNIESEVVDGIAIDNQTFEIVPHSWNAVKLKNKWYLIDCTWASFVLNTTEINDFYFLTPPEQFVMTHYPNELKWTLMDNAPSLKQFQELPIIDGTFFKYATTKPPTFQIINVSKHEVIVDNYVKKGYTQYVYVESLSGEGIGVKIDPIKAPNGDTLSFKIRDLETGTYSLIVSVETPSADALLPSLILTMLKFKLEVP